MQLSVIIPVYRNADTLVELHRRITQILEGLGSSYEIIFVNDACPKGSWGVLEDLCREDTHVCAIALEKNYGQNTAVLVGLTNALGERAVIMDADLQDPPEAIPRLLTEMEKGFPVVFAGRRGKYEPLHRLLTSKVFKYLLHLICGLPTDAGIYVAISAEGVQRLLCLYAPKPFIVAMIGCSGLAMTSIPVVRTNRSSGESAYSSWKRLETGLLAVLWALLWKYWFNPRQVQPLKGVISIKKRLGARFQGLDIVIGET